MAHDPVLADRLRAALEGWPVEEKRMFGVLGFLVRSHLTVASTAEGLLVRVDPARAPLLLAEPGVEPFVMSGRRVAGWLHVTGELDDDALERWVALALERVEDL